MQADRGWAAPEIYDRWLPDLINLYVFDLVMRVRLYYACALQPASIAPRQAGPSAVALIEVIPEWLGYAVSMVGRTYAQNRPYLLPETLGELGGPLGGVIQLPLRLDWSERTEFRLDDPAERNVMYERVIREATRREDLSSYLNEQVLRQVWNQLFLPVQVRRTWEDRFPDLRLAA